MIANVINALAVLIGTLLGTTLKSSLNKREDVQNITYAAVGLLSLFLGIKMALLTQRILYVALATVFGSIIGQSLNIEKGIRNIGKNVRRLFPSADTSALPDAFLDSSLLFCAGSMAIVGALQAGMADDYTILFTKSVLDGTMAVFLSAILGAGVGLSAISIIVYQGSLTLMARFFGPFIDTLMLSEISSVGGIIVMSIGISLMGIKKIPSGNFLIALPIVIVLVFLDPILPEIFKN